MFYEVFVNSDKNKMFGTVWEISALVKKLKNVKWVMICGIF